MKAVWIGLITQHQDRKKLAGCLDELEFSCLYCRCSCTKAFAKVLKQILRTFSQEPEKQEEIKNFGKENEIGAVVFE